MPAVHGAWPVEGQGQLVGHPCQRASPVRDLTSGETVLGFRLAEACAATACSPRTAPAARTIAGIADAPGRVRGRQIPAERGLGPSVRRNVMQRQHQDVPALAQDEQVGPHGKVRPQIEGTAAGLPHRDLQLRLVDVPDGQWGMHIGRVQDQLVGLSRLHAHDGAKTLVPDDHVPHRFPQRVRVNVTAQVQDDGQVVQRGGTVPLVQEPYAVLGRGERDADGWLPAGELGAGSAGPEQRAQRADRRGIEELPDGHVHAEGVPELADQSSGEEGVTAEVEEAVVHTDPRDAEDLREERAEPLLLRGARGTVGRSRDVLRRGQGPVVDLSVRREGNSVQGHERGRDHVLGQCARGVVAQCVDVHGAVTHVVRHQALVAVGLAGGDHDLVEPGRADRTVSISPGSTRKPRILTWSSARPRKPSMPSGLRRTMSPVRYMRLPAGPWGQGRSARR